MKHLHVIPVPFGAEPEDAWAEITTLGHLAFPPASEDECYWATIECDGDECSDVEHAS